MTVTHSRPIPADLDLPAERDTESAVPGESVVDYSVHGLLGIRLVNPSPKDVRTATRQIGLPPGAFPGEPGITVRFVPQLPLRAPVRYLGRGDVAFDDNAFCVLRSRNLARARAQIAFERIGRTCEITCESGLPAIPLLKPLTNVAMLACGVVPLHAAAFSFGGLGVLVSGWSHGSKTGSLLSFMASGAEFVGDEWVYVSESRGEMYGLPESMEVRSWYLRDLPRYRAHVGSADRMRLWATRLLARAVEPLVPRSERSGSLAAKAVRYAQDRLLDQQCVHLHPHTLFGRESCPLRAPLDRVILTVSHDARDLRVTQADPEILARRLAVSFVYEQWSLYSCYLKHRFAFPERRSELLDHLEDIHYERARAAIADKECYVLYHPYPVSPAALREAIQPLLTSK